jgi:predicted alternative tryptophan synthase beta-subunit
MIDLIARKYALIEVIMRLENDADLATIENAVSILKQAPAPKTKTRKSKKEAPQSSTLTEEEAKNYVLRYNPSLKVYIKIPKDVAERISKTIDLEPIKKAQNYKKMGREYVRQLANEMNITESDEELLEMLKQ